MKALILCYSSSGNTRLVGKRIAAALTERGVKTTVRDPIREPRFSDLGGYDLVGFGASTMAWKPSYGFYEFMGLVPGQQKRKAAFVFNTSAGMPANTLLLMAKTVSKKNFTVLDGLSVMAEDCWPMARQFGEPGQGPVGQPDDKALEVVGPFAMGLVQKLEKRDLAPRHFKFERTPLHYIGQQVGRQQLRMSMGRKSVDTGKCKQCGSCAAACAAHAISLDPYPTFSSRCMGCWACYNVCPEEAITTLVTGSRGHYKGPELRA